MYKLHPKQSITKRKGHDLEVAGYFNKHMIRINNMDLVAVSQVGNRPPAAAADGVDTQVAVHGVVVSILTATNTTTAVQPRVAQLHQVIGS